MADESRFSWAARGESFRHAFRGIATLIDTQHNARIHAAMTVAVVVLGVVVGASRLDWILLVFAMAAVWAAEAFNTALEWLCDVASPEYHPLVKQAKDVAAAGVLLASIGSAIVGLLVLGPPLLALLTGGATGAPR